MTVTGLPWPTPQTCIYLKVLSRLEAMFDLCDFVQRLSAENSIREFNTDLVTTSEINTEAACSWAYHRHIGYHAAFI